MPPINELLQSMTNRLVLVTVIAFFIVEALFAGERSGMELYFWKNPNFQIWQLFTHLFLHGGFTHLAFNMFALWSFGRVLERVWGNQRFLIFYLVCGVGAGVISIAVNQFEFQMMTAELVNSGLSDANILNMLETGSAPASDISRERLIEYYRLFHTPAVGASGAIYGILVAFALLFPNFKIMLIFIPVPIAAKYFVPVLLLIDLTAGITNVSIFGQNIAHFAHIGGAIVGFILVKTWLKQGLS